MRGQGRGGSWRGAFALLLALGLFGAALVGAPQASGETPAPTAKVTVDINQAGLEELVTIPGIGEALAKRILEFRQQQGPFQRVEDLMKVRGIGEKSLEKIRPYVKVGKGRS